MSRKAWKPTKEQLEDLQTWAGNGMTIEQMAHALGIHPQTLFKKMAIDKGNNSISDAIKQGKSKAIRIMTGKLYEIGLDDTRKSQLGAIIFWLKNVAKWSDRQTHEGDPENPINIQHKLPDLKGPRARNILDILLTAHGKKSKKKSKKKPKKKPKPK